MVASASTKITTVPNSGTAYVPTTSISEFPSWKFIVISLDSGLVVDS